MPPVTSSQTGPGGPADVLYGAPVSAATPVTPVTAENAMLGIDIRTAKATWTFTVVALGLFAVYSVRRTLFVFLLSIFFAYMIYPAVARLARLAPKRLSHTASTAVVFASLVVLIGALASMIIPPIADQASNLAQKLPALLSDPKVLDRVPLPERMLPYRARMVEFVQTHVASGTALALPAATKIGQAALGIVGKLVFLILIPILAFLLIKDASQIRGSFLSFVAAGGHRSMWRNIVADLDVLLGRYIRALLILSAVTLVSFSIVFVVAQVPYGLLLAALAGVFEFIPVVGPAVAALIILLVSGASGYEHLLLLVGFLGVYRLLQDYVLNPYLMSGGVAVPPLLVLFGLLAGEELGGIVGIFLSVPTLAAAKIVASHVWREVFAKRRLDTASG